MPGESCNSRHLSWLMKSCFPNPDNHHHHHLRRIPAIIKPRENSPISSLPDDLLLECLSRVSLSSLPSLPFVCRRWSLLLLSPSFILLRQLRLPFHPTLFSLLTSGQFATLRLGLDLSWNLTSFSLPTHSSSICRLIAIGPRIYIISRTYMYRVDTWTQAVTARSATIYSRKKFAAAVVSGKIYVAGGAARTSAVEEYDPNTNTWRVVSNATRKRYGCLGASVEGIFYIIGGLRIGREDGPEAHNVYASSMDLYDVASGTWLRSRAVPGGGCVVAACSVDKHVYVLTSHAVELSFWRFNGQRRGGGSFGEWRRLKSPPLQAQARLDSTARYCCSGVGDKIVLIQVRGRVENLMIRRDGINGYDAMSKEVLVMVYDCHGEEWCRGPDMLDVTSCATCVSVEF